MSVTDEIKSRIDAVELIGETVKLRRSGKSYSGFCPFHSNTRTPAFVVFPDSGTWRCFGQCGEGGDIFQYVMKKEGWDFPQALKHLAQRAGVQLEPMTPEKEAKKEENERLLRLLEEAVIYFRHQLVQGSAGKKALEYLQKRGLTQDSIEKFELGYALNSYDAGLGYFVGKGYSWDELMEVGLISEKRDGGGYFDRFRDRVIFPIRTGNGVMAGFGARTMNPDDPAKYLNSPQTEFFDKGSLLYGLHASRKAIRASSQVVIVEGYMDVIVPHQAGFENVVSPMGTALSENHLRQIKRLASKIILALDADAAGEKATMRGLEVARGSLERSGEIVFDARGLMRHEARLKTDLRVTTLPEGQDPDQVVQRDAEEWRKILEDARPIVIHVMETLAARQNLEDPKTKSEVAGQVLPLIEDVPDPVEREAYRQRLARLLRVDERSLIGTAARGSRRASKRSPGREIGAGKFAHDVLSVSQQQLAHELEGHCLRMLLLQPEMLYQLNRFLQESDLNRFDAQDFSGIDYQVLAGIVSQSLEQDQVDPLQFIREAVPETLTTLYIELSESDQGSDASAQKVVSALARALMRIRSARNAEEMEYLRSLQQEYQEEGGLQMEAYQEMILHHIKKRDRLDRAIGNLFQLD
jgi:DNA primase